MFTYRFGVVPWSDALKLDICHYESKEYCHINHYDILNLNFQTLWLNISEPTLKHPKHLTSIWVKKSKPFETNYSRFRIYQQVCSASFAKTAWATRSSTPKETCRRGISAWIVTCRISSTAHLPTYLFTTSYQWYQTPVLISPRADIPSPEHSATCWLPVTSGSDQYVTFQHRSHTWCDQAKWVGTRLYWFLDIANSRLQFLL